MSLTGRLKKIKFIHWAYNLFHYKSLLHNKSAYGKYKLNKSLTASTSGKDFPDLEPGAWLDRGDSGLLARQKPGFMEFSSEIRQQLLTWSTNDYMNILQFLNEGQVDYINTEIDTLICRGKLTLTRDHKYLEANLHSDLIDGLTKKKDITYLLSFILDREVALFQTLNFLHGSQQRAHSDSIHMTTYPLGYLIAAWIALKDTNPENGPLFYYPGTHRFPYLLNRDFNQGRNWLTLGNKDYADYEDAIERIIEEKKPERKVFIARKGDLLIWHANLIHGGREAKKPELTRRSMVVHYFAKGVVKYHEITERPSLMAE
jgi:ectoine hydroxylase